nr:AP-2 complex subunit alpha-2 [Tanacetum cinerariifolium]
EMHFLYMPLYGFFAGQGFSQNTNDERHVSIVNEMYFEITLDRTTASLINFIVKKLYNLFHESDYTQLDKLLITSYWPLKLSERDICSTRSNSGGSSIVRGRDAKNCQIDNDLFRFRVDVILQLIDKAGDFGSDDIWFRVVQIITNNEDLQAIEGPPGVSGIDVLSEGDALALAPVEEQENGVKVLPSPSLVLSIMSRSMPTRSGKSSSKYVGMFQFSTSLTSLEPRCLKDKYEALILHGNDKNASDIDKRIGSAIAQGRGCACGFNSISTSGLI